MAKQTFEAIWSKHMSKIDLENASPFAREWFAEGEAKGEVKGEAKALMRLLGKRFGDVPPRILELVERASMAELDRWFDRVLEAKTLDAVFAPTEH